MALSGVVISSIVYELNNKIAGGRITKIAQPEADELILTIGTEGGSHKLLISANASIPKIHLTSVSKPSPVTAPAFCMLLRKHIGGGRILSITQEGLERIIRINIEHSDEMGDMGIKTLLIEIMGKYSNIILLEGNKILDSIKRVPVSTSSLREVLPGREYFFPDELEKINLLNSKLHVLFGFSENVPSARFISQNYCGISTAMAYELCHRAGIDGDKPAEITDSYKLMEVLDTLVEKIKSGSYRNTIYYRDGVPAEFSAFTLQSLSSLDKREFESASEMLEAFYSEKEAILRAKQRSAGLCQQLNTQLTRAVKKLELLEKQLADSEKRDKYRLYGELIRANAYSIEVGAESVGLQNYYDNNELLTVPLDRDLSVQDNATRYFDKYKKLSRTYEAVKLQIEQTGRDIEYLRSIESAIAFAETEADLLLLHEELVQGGFIKKTVSGKKSKPPKSSLLHFISCDGFDIYVGKNNLQNEQLTFKLAGGNDLWFHAKGVAGSHVIVRCAGTEPSNEGYAQAASLALHYSSASDAEKGEVDYTRRKYIKKPSGALPGEVIYHVYNSMIAVNDISGIKKVR